MLAPTIRISAFGQFEDMCTCGYLSKAGLQSAGEECPSSMRGTTPDEMLEGQWPSALLQLQRVQVLMNIAAATVHVLVVVIVYRFAAHSGRLEDAVEQSEMRRGKLRARLTDLKHETMLPLRSLQAGLSYFDA